MSDVTTGPINGGDSDSAIPTTFKVVQCILTTAVGVLPLALQRSFSAARYISMAALISLTFTLLVVVFEMPFFKTSYFETYPDLNPAL